MKRLLGIVTGCMMLMTAVFADNPSEQRIVSLRQAEDCAYSKMQAAKASAEKAQALVNVTKQAAESTATDLKAALKDEQSAKDNTRQWSEKIVTATSELNNNKKAVTDLRITNGQLVSRINTLSLALKQTTQKLSQMRDGLAPVANTAIELNKVYESTKVALADSKRTEAIEKANLANARADVEQAEIALNKGKTNISNIERLLDKNSKEQSVVQLNIKTQKELLVKIEKEVVEAELIFKSSVSKEKAAQAKSIEQDPADDTDLSKMQESEIRFHLEQRTKRLQESREAAEKGMRAALANRINTERSLKQKKESAEDMRDNIEKMVDKIDCLVIERQTMAEKLENAKAIGTSLAAKLKEESAKHQSLIAKYSLYGDVVKTRMSALDVAKKNFIDAQAKQSAAEGSIAKVAKEQLILEAAITSTTASTRKIDAQTKDLDSAIVKTANNVQALNNTLNATTICYKQKRVERIKVEVEWQLENVDYENASVALAKITAELKQLEIDLRVAQQERQKAESELKLLTSSIN